MASIRLIYDPAQRKMVPVGEKWVEARVHIISDDLPMTKSPVDGKTYFTSKRALRAHYRQHGVEEVGTSYENEEYIEREERRYQEEQESRTDRSIKQNIIDRVIHGKR